MKDVSKLLEHCNNLQKSGHYTVITGDFNLQITHVQELEKRMNANNISQFIQNPTHELGSVLDLMFTNYKQVSTYNIPVYYSDHHLIAAFVDT